MFKEASFNENHRFSCQQTLSQMNVIFVNLCYTVALDSMLLFKNFVQDPESAKALSPLISKSLRVSVQVLMSIDL